MWLPGKVLTSHTQGCGFRSQCQNKTKQQQNKNQQTTTKTKTATTNNKKPTTKKQNKQQKSKTNQQNKQKKQNQTNRLFIKVLPASTPSISEVEGGESRGRLISVSSRPVSVSFRTMKATEKP